MIVAGTMLVLIALTMAGWAYLANVAIRTRSEVSLDIALDGARRRPLRRSPRRCRTNAQERLLPRSEFGGPLYVLGAIKIARCGKSGAGRSAPD